MIIDFHARLHPGLLSGMDAAGIDRAAVSAGGLIGLDRLSVHLTEGGRAEVKAANDDVYDHCARSAGRLLPVYFADPVRDLRSYTSDAREFCGLELSPAVHGFRLDDPRVADLLLVAAEVRHFVYVVTVGRAGAQARDLARLAGAHPSLTFVWGHCGHTGLDFLGLTEVSPVPNVMAELSCCLTVTARAAVDRLGVSRVLFGTEAPLQDPGVELAKIAALDLSPRDRHAVLAGNAGRVLRLGPAQPHPPS
ncbi:amidohydrolase family protein [Actinoplanes sp. TFC3]|uniref:amidohydrolase family protein n=1 Tax=Actinoplanes sp. TFC3 TaxID=1710355 RepID=UPI0008310EC8|nr:amidohydrolase family protein [Actinoplanes sp. TFC3]